MFFLELPHLGDSDEYTQYTIFIIKKKISLNYPRSAAIGIFTKGFKNEFETAMEKIATEGLLYISKMFLIKVVDNKQNVGKYCLFFPSPCLLLCGLRL